MAMQNGAVVRTWLDRDSNPTDPPQRWSLDGEEIEEWRVGLPSDHVRTSPQGYGKGAIAYLTETGKAFRPDKLVELTLENVVNSHRLDEKPGIEVPEHIRDLANSKRSKIVVIGGGID